MASSYSYGSTAITSRTFSDSGEASDDTRAKKTVVFFRHGEARSWVEEGDKTWFCDKCSSAMSGTRYRCQICAEYDLCSSCHKRAARGKVHRHIAFDEVPISVDEDTLRYDPPLSTLGVKQAKKVNKKLDEVFADLPPVELVVVSPLARSIETCNIMFGDYLKEHPQVPVVVCELSAERLGGPESIGRTPQELKERHPNIDFSGITKKVWWYTPSQRVARKFGFTKDITQDPTVSYQLYRKLHVANKTQEYYDEVDPGFSRRASAWKQWLRARPEKMIVVVGHANITRRVLETTHESIGHCDMIVSHMRYRPIRGKPTAASGGVAARKPKRRFFFRSDKKENAKAHKIVGPIPGGAASAGSSSPELFAKDEFSLTPTFSSTDGASPSS